MIPRLRSLLSVAFLAAALVAACTAAEPFDPSGPCTTGGRAPGAYPELESRVPDRLAGAAPTSLDSGRSCLPEELGALVRQGVEELRFAGAVWPQGDRSGTTIAVFTAPGLRQAWMADFYEAGARAARKTENVERSIAAVAGVSVVRIDTLNDESFQTVAVLPERDDLVPVVIVASDVRETGTRAAHEERVAAAVETAAAAG